MSDSLLATAPVDTAALVADVARRLKAGTLVPYLGPGLLAEADDAVPVPITPEAVAVELNRKSPTPSKIRSNMWGVAQFIEQRRHRKTLIAFMAEIFAAPVAPTALHAALAGLPLPLIVDTWYDGAMRSALSGRNDWIEIQGITRALETVDIWFRAYAPNGAVVNLPDPGDPRTILYKPHGAVTPARNFLVADSDYVEVLTEIDIQSPIPEPVRRLRGDRGFVFLGCAFHDQMLRTYARQIAKRSAGPHFVFACDEELSRNERKFVRELGAQLIDAPAMDLLEHLA